MQHVDGTSEIRSITIQVNQPNCLIDTSWAVVTLNGSQVPLPKSTLSVLFAGESNVSVNGGCSNHSGGHAAHINSISIGLLAGAGISCGEELDTQETTFLQVLELAATFALSSDQLVLYGADNVEVMRLTALHALPLT